MNNNEVNLILSRLDSMEKNIESRFDGQSKWISKVEDNYSLLQNRNDKKFALIDKRINKIGLKIAGFGSLFGFTGMFIGAWINKKFFG